MCRAPHGQTRAYEERDGKMAPVFDVHEADALIRHGFLAYEKGILDFANCMLANFGNAVDGSMKTTLLYMEHIAQEPPKDVLEFFGSMPSSETGRAEAVVEYAPRLTKEDIRNIFFHKTYEPLEAFYKGTNLNYSVLRADGEEKALMEQCRRDRDSLLGAIDRQKKERGLQMQRAAYGRAAFYPIRLLEERVILYGAGRLGRDLYRRLQEDPGHCVVLWVDKQAFAIRQRGLDGVGDLSELKRFHQEPVVIAVASEKTAGEIRGELMEMGIEKERIQWFYPWNHPYGAGVWRTEGIG